VVKLNWFVFCVNCAARGSVDVDTSRISTVIMSDR
jgi:hypothetical protein